MMVKLNFFIIYYYLPFTKFFFENVLNEHFFPFSGFLLPYFDLAALNCITFQFFWGFLHSSDNRLHRSMILAVYVRERRRLERAQPPG